MSKKIKDKIEDSSDLKLVSKPATNLEKPVISGNAVCKINVGMIETTASLQLDKISPDLKQEKNKIEETACLIMEILRSFSVILQFDGAMSVNDIMGFQTFSNLMTLSIEAFTSEDPVLYFKNNVLAAYTKFLEELNKIKFAKDSSLWMGIYRDYFNKFYSFSAIPIGSYEALSVALKEKKVDTIIDPICGSGFMGAILETLGLKVECSDLNPPKLVWETKERKIEKKDLNKLKYEDMKENTALMISWVDNKLSLTETIKKFGGKYIIYAGDPVMCGDKKLNTYLTNNYNVAVEIRIYHFSSINDCFRLLSKK